MTFYTKSETNGLGWHHTLQEAIQYAEKDSTVCKITFTIEKTGETISFLRWKDSNGWVLR